jgi:hypothetical protein
MSQIMPATDAMLLATPSMAEVDDVSPLVILRPVAATEDGILFNERGGGNEAYR